MKVDEPSAAPDRPILEYASPREPRFPRLRALWRAFLEAGPWLPRPSMVTGALLLICCIAAFFLSQVPPAWRLIRTDTLVPPMRQPSAICHLPKSDAVAALGADGRFRVWKPWTGETLMLGGSSQSIGFISPSADESLLLVQSQTGTALWDVRTGNKKWRLDKHLGPNASSNGLAVAALSPDASRVAMVDQSGGMTLWDVSGKSGKLLISRGALQEYRFWEPEMRFTEDGQSIILNANDVHWLLDASTLEPKAELKYDHFDRLPVLFIDGGARLVTMAAPGRTTAWVRESSVVTGAEEKKWGIKDMNAAAQLAFSPGRNRLFVGGSRSFCLDRATGRMTQQPTDWLPANSESQFFPDGRRLLCSRGPDNSPSVIDTDTARHVATLPLSSARLARNPIPPVRRVLISADGKFAAAVLANGDMPVYQQVGNESAWGVLGTMQFWILTACTWVLAISLTRDALRTRRGGRVPRARLIVAWLMIMLGAAALVCPFVWAALGRWDMYTWWYADGWTIWLLILHLFAGLGLLMRSGGWSILAGLMLMFDLLLLLTGISLTFGKPERIFDRLWIMNDTILGGASAVAGVLALVAFALLASSGKAAAIAAATNPATDQ